MAKFDVTEKRILGLLSVTEDELNSPEAEALRKIVDTYPFILLVAEHGFDPGIAAAAIRMVCAEYDLQTAIKALKVNPK